MLAALLTAAKTLARLLLDCGADPDQATFEWHRTPLHNACYKGYIDAARLLLEKGAEVDPVEVNGRTPLHHACQEGHLDVMRLLLARGADQFKHDNSGKKGDYFSGKTPYDTAEDFEWGALVAELRRLSDSGVDNFSSKKRRERVQAEFELARSELELNRSARKASLSARGIRVQEKDWEANLTQRERNARLSRRLDRLVREAQERKDLAARREDANAATTTTQSPTVQPLDVDAASSTNPN